MKDLRVPIWVQEHHGLGRTKEPVRIGVPLPRGLLFAAGDVGVMYKSDGYVPSQARPVSKWPDNSIKWLLVDFFVTLGPHETISLTLLSRTNGSDSSAFDNGIKIRLMECPDAFDVDTGPAQFVIPKKFFLPFRSVRIGGVEILSGSQTCLVEKDGLEYQPVVERFVVEERGAVRSLLRAEGRFVSTGSKELACFKARLAFFAGLSHVRLEFQIRNPRAAVHSGGLWDLGDPGSIYFRDLSMHLHPCGKVDRLRWYAESPEDIRSSNSRNWILYQDSSGGENWSSRNHVDRHGQPSVSFCGYHVCEQQHGGDTSISEGMRAQPGVQLESSPGWLAATVKDFWENFPKALRLDDGHLSIGLFPRESTAGFELQGGEQKRHVVLLDFGLPEQTMAVPMVQHPVHVWIDPDWIEETKAVPYFVSQKDDSNQDYAKYVTNIIEGSNSFFKKREVVDEYGWRNFGDLYADHEAVDHRGPEILVSHYNNQYDFIYGALVHYLRTGDRRWCELMDEAARHTIDIDIYHTDEDKPAYNRGLFWHTDHYRDAGTCTHRTYSRRNGNGRSYGGGASNEHNYTSGLLQYYYVTGDPEAAAAVVDLADWVIAMDDGSQTLLGLFDEGPTGVASSTASRLYHKPGRGAGNSINALIDAYLLASDRRYFKKADELIQRCIHPKDNITELKLDEPEYRWSYLVFLQVLGKYLDAKVDLGEMDYNFYYARDSLQHYAGWMAGNEVPYKDVLHKVEIPTETWPAHDIRKCHVFHLAAKYSPPDKRQLFNERASFFFDRCLTDLLSFNTAYVTRPLVILSVYGHVHSYFQKYPQENYEYGSHGYDFGDPQRFLPQRERIRATFFKKVQVVARHFQRVSGSKMHSLKSRLYGS